MDLKDSVNNEGLVSVKPSKERSKYIKPIFIVVTALLVILSFTLGLVIGSDQSKTSVYTVPSEENLDKETLTESPRTITIDDVGSFPDIPLPLGVSLKNAEYRYEIIYEEDPSDENVIEAWDSILVNLGAELTGKNEGKIDSDRKYVLDGKELVLSFGGVFGECPDCPPSVRTSWMTVTLNYPAELDFLKVYNLNFPVHSIENYYRYEFTLEDNLTPDEIRNFYDKNLRDIYSWRGDPPGRVDFFDYWRELDVKDCKENMQNVVANSTDSCRNWIQLNNDQPGFMIINYHILLYKYG